MFTYYSLTSGNPATLVSSERIPASSEAEITTFQSTAERIADVPIVAAAVYAIVLTARTPAAFNHFSNFSFILISSLKFNLYTVDFLTDNTSVAVITVAFGIACDPRQPLIRAAEVDAVVNLCACVGFHH